MHNERRVVVCKICYDRCLRPGTDCCTALKRQGVAMSNGCLDGESTIQPKTKFNAISPAHGCLIVEGNDSIGGKVDLRRRTTLRTCCVIDCGECSLCGDEEQQSTDSKTKSRDQHATKSRIESCQRRRFR